MSVRNALERARLRQANRIVSSGQRHWGRADLMRIEPEDILESRVMTEDPDGPAPAVVRQLRGS